MKDIEFFYDFASPNCYVALAKRFRLFIENVETKDRLRSDTQKAYERGVFGAPTFFIDGDMYWRTPEILWYLERELE